MEKNLIVLAGNTNFNLPDSYLYNDIIKCNSIFEGAIEKLDREVENRRLYQNILVINTDFIKEFEGSEEVLFSHLLNAGGLERSSIYTSRYNKTPYRYNDELILNEIVIPSPYLFICDSLTFNVLSSYRDEELHHIHEYRFQVQKKPFIDNFDPIHFSFYNILNCMNIDIKTV